MNVLRKIALPCGITGSVSTFLLSAFLFLSVPQMGGAVAVLRDESGQIIDTITEKASTSDNVMLLVFTGITAIMGLITLLVLLFAKNPRPSRILSWITVVVILSFGLFTMGFVILPAAVLLVLSAIGLQDY